MEILRCHKEKVQQQHVSCVFNEKHFLVPLLCTVIKKGIILVN